MRSFKEVSKLRIIHVTAEKRRGVLDEVHRHTYGVLSYDDDVSYFRKHANNIIITRSHVPNADHPFYYARERRSVNVFMHDIKLE